MKRMQYPSHLVGALRAFGFDAKEARVYLAGLELGPTTVLELSRRTQLARTTLYPILEDLLSTGTSFLVSNVETNQKAFVEQVARTHLHVKIRVNMDPGIVACPDPARIYAEIDRILAFAGGRPNCLLGTGALPFETPPEHVRLIREYVA